MGKTCILPLMDKGDPHCGRRVCGYGVRHRLREDDPAHDPNDFEVGLRHNLESIRVLDDNGKINENGGKYQGMDRYEARKAIVADLEAGPPGKDHRPYPQRGHLLPLRNRCGAPHLRPVVRQDGAPGPKEALGWSTTGRSSSSPTASPRPTPTGWRTSMTGASPASSGGATASPPGPATTVGG